MEEGSLNTKGLMKGLWKNQFDEMWFSKYCVEQGEAQHVAITQYVAIRTNAPLLMNAYQTPFHRTTFAIYKFNIKVTIEKWKPMKKGRNYSHIILIELMWVHKTIPHSTSMESLTCWSHWNNRENLW